MGSRDPLARPADQRDESCDRSVPGAINAFLVSDGVESAIARAVALGGHAEVQAGIAGGLAEAHFGALPSWMALAVLDRLPPSLMTVVRAFFERF